MTQLPTALTFDDGQIIGVFALMLDELSSFDNSWAILAYKFEHCCDKMYFKGLRLTNFIWTKFSLMWLCAHFDNCLQCFILFLLKKNSNENKNWCFTIYYVHGAYEVR